MISLILYGRNDSYGYNLHKRAAISLNCMAEVLDAPDDEILRWTEAHCREDAGFMTMDAYKAKMRAKLAH